LVQTGVGSTGLYKEVVSYLLIRRNCQTSTHSSTGCS
jgi:hypothetical protein